MEQNEEITEAMNDISGVKKELIKLQDKIKQYSDASQRLGTIGDILAEVTSAIQGMQNAFSVLLKGAADSRAHIDQSTKAIIETKETLPSIVKQIESLDNSKINSQMSEMLKEFQLGMTRYEKLISDIEDGLKAQNLANSELEKRIAMPLDLLSTKVQRIELDLNQLLKQADVPDEKHNTIMDELNKISINQNEILNAVGKKSRGNIFQRKQK